MDTLPPFPGFRPEALQFLRDLRENNDRDWFKPRKAVYDDDLLWPARCLVADVATEASRAGLPLTADPMKGIFRIYRDTRFSKNKAPYKTHVGLVWSRSGNKNDEGSLYVHVEPGGSFLAAGFWSPEAPLLRRWRERIAGDSAGWLAMAAEIDEAGLTLGGYDSLKRMPRGYESFADTELADALRWKGAITTRKVDDDDVQRPDFAVQVVEFARSAMPLLEWGWSVEDVT